MAISKTCGILVAPFLVFMILVPFEAVRPASSQSQSGPPELCAEHLNNPILNDSAGYTYTTPTGSWFAYNNTFQEPTVVRTSEGLRLWYAGYHDGVWGIYTATSNDGGNWIINPVPVLTSGQNGTWDSAPLMAPSVLYNGTGYMMYFRSSAGSVYTSSIGVAFSSDGVRWEEYVNNPVLRPGPASYDSNWIYEASVLLKEGSYYMWYAGSASPQNATNGYFYYEAIDLATSSDGLHWSKYQNNPVFVGAVVGNTTVGRHPNVLNINGTLLMFYGDGYGIKYVVSTDGISWSTPSQYLVDVAQAYWKSGWVSQPAALLNGSTLVLWYSGESPVSHPWSPYIGGIGLAYCNLLPVQVRTTTTIVTTPIYTTTSPTTVIITQYFTATKTTEVNSPDLRIFQGTTIGLVSTVGVLAALLVLFRRKRT